MPSSRPNSRKALVVFVAQGLLLLGCVPFRGGQAEPNSADRPIFWANCSELVKLSDAHLDEWKSRGIDGFVCVHQHLKGFGGTQQFTRLRDAPLTGAAFDLQRSLRDSHIVQRAKNRGMKMYFGFYLANAQNASTPLLDWFDDAGWKQRVLPTIGDAAGAAQILGFDGMGFDQELYGLDDAVQNWPWNYPSNTRPEADVRAKVKQRGQEAMRAMLDAFPGLELMTYAYTFDDDWKSVVQEEYNNIKDVGRSSTYIDWYDGLSSVDGYKAIRLFSSVFYKLYLPARDWDTALTYEFNAIYSLFSRRLSNWPQAASRVHLSPSIWIDNGDATTPAAYDSAHPPDYVEAQLQAMKKWGTGGEFVIFPFHGLYGSSAGKYRDAFDYGPYVPAIRRASTPTVVDTQPPTLSLSAPSDGYKFETTGNRVDVSGTASDNMAVRVVRWTNDRGGGGTARTNWHVHCGDYRTGYESQMDWAISGIRLLPGTNKITVTAEDIKGLQTTKAITVVAGTARTTADRTDPTVRLSSPSCNAVVSGRVTVTAEAADNVAVAKVEFAVDGAVKSAGTDPPYSWDWDTLTTGDGVKTLSAKVYDTAGRAATTSMPVTVQFPPSLFTVRKGAAPPTIDGKLTEYSASSPAVFGRPATTNDVTVRALWDANNLYLAYDVRDEDLNASDVRRDGKLWEQDSVEWFVDVKADGGGEDRPSSPYMGPDDYQGIVNTANVQFDARGSSAGSPDASWNGSWTSSVVKRGTVNAGSDADVGYFVEISIPWTTLGLATAPAENSTIGLSFAVDDKDASGSTGMMWPDVTTGFQNASKWQRVKLLAAER